MYQYVQKALILIKWELLCINLVKTITDVRQRRRLRPLYRYHNGELRNPKIGRNSFLKSVDTTYTLSSHLEQRKSLVPRIPWTIYWLKSYSVYSSFFDKESKRKRDQLNVSTTKKRSLNISAPCINTFPCFLSLLSFDRLIFPSLRIYRIVHLRSPTNPNQNKTKTPIISNLDISTGHENCTSSFRTTSTWKRRTTTCIL